MKLIGGPEWGEVEPFKDRFVRGRNWEALKPLLVDAIKDWEKDAITKAAQARGVPCTVVASPADLLNSAHLAERQFFVHTEHPVAGKITYPGLPFKMTESSGQRTGPAPCLGEHNEEILCKRLGYSHGELVVMRASGVI